MSGPTPGAYALVYGSRTWPHVNIVRDLLVGLKDRWGDRLVLVCGMARSGADDHARFWAEQLEVTLERFPAQWLEHDREGATAVPCHCPPEGRLKPGRGDFRFHDCPTAGYRRNQAMADRLAEVRAAGRPATAYGFRKDGISNGTDDMTRRLEAAGIPTALVLTNFGANGTRHPLMGQRAGYVNRRAAEAERIQRPRPHPDLLEGL